MAVGTEGALAVGNRNPDIVYSTTIDNEFAISDDIGATWTQISTPNAIDCHVPVNANSADTTVWLINVTDKKLYKYDPINGLVYKNILEDATTTMSERVVTYRSDGDVVYTVADTNGSYTWVLSYSGNGGTSWTARQNFSEEVTGLTVWPYNGAWIFMLENDRPVYSDDYGVTLTGKLGDWASSIGSFGAPIKIQPLWLTMGDEFDADS